MDVRMGTNKDEHRKDFHIVLLDNLAMKLRKEDVWSGCWCLCSLRARQDW